MKNRIRFVMESLGAMGTAIGFDCVGLRVCPGFDYNDIDDADPVETYGRLFDKHPGLG